MSPRHIAFFTPLVLVHLGCGLVFLVGWSSIAVAVCLITGALQIFGITAGWAAFVGLVDLVLGTNFMYLRHKPTVGTPLDWMGPWPVYIGVSAGVALVVFHVLALPFRRGRRPPPC